MNKLIPFIIVIISFCSTPKKLKDSSNFWKAKDYTSSPTREKINENLIAVTTSNPNLIWNNKKKEKILVLTLKNISIESTNSNKYETWVTIVPELKNFCSKLNLPEEELILRVNQYLGLLPDSKRNYLNSIWVSPKDLFRPCHDPEITDSKCDLDYPKNVSKDHKKWFEKAKEDNKKYPWTRLGYTADWGKDEPYIGASEFLIRKGAAIEVESVKTVKEYCSGE